MRRFLIGLVVAGLLVVGLAAPVLAHNPGSGDAAVSSGVYLDQPTLIRVAQALGLTQDELLTRLQGGETISDIAADQNVPEEEIVEAIISPYVDELRLQVKYGYITQEQADALIERARDHARSILEQDLSSSGEYDSYSWEEMEDACNEMMGGWEGSQSGWGGMGGNLGGGMMGGQGGMMGGGMTGSGWNGGQSGWGGMMGGGWNGGQGGGMTGGSSNGGQNSSGGLMSGWGDSISRGLGNIMRGFSGGFGGGMMGGGMR